MKIVAYELLVAGDPAMLGVSVRTFLEQGYQPIGSPGYHEFQWYQAVVKYGDGNPIYHYLT